MTMQEGNVYIYLTNMPVIIDSQAENNSDGFALGKLFWTW